MSEVVEVHIDPDADPDAVVGKRIEVTWVSGNIFRGVVTVSLYLCTVTFCANPANDLTCPPSYINIENRIAICNLKGRCDQRQHVVQYEDGDEVTYQLTKGRRGFETRSFRLFDGAVSQEEGRLQVIRQVKRTFCFLKNCVNSYYDPLSLVEACRTLQLDADVMQQHDASEVFYKLLDRIEGALKTPDHAPFHFVRIRNSQFDSLPRTHL